MPACRRIIAAFVLVLCGSIPVALAQDARATYLANEAVLLTSGDTAVLFDPLFDNGFGQYQMLPDEMEKALFAGKPPFDGIDAVFVSHAHGDHFSASLMLNYLRAQPNVALYAPMQAVAALRSAAASGDAELFDRVTGLALDVGDAGTYLQLDAIGISAVRIPHSGWPDRMTDIENIAFRITLDSSVSVVHLGDAVVSAEHFREQRAFWHERSNTLALPPYWFFLSDEGKAILSSDLQAVHAVGIHVPEKMPDNPDERPVELRGYDLFTEPGQSRPVAEREGIRND